MLWLPTLCLLAGTAFLAASALRLPGLVSTLLAGYLALVLDVVLTTVVLSPPRLVTGTGVLAAQSVLFAGSLVLWLVRGRPLAPAGAALAAARQLLRSPAATAFVALAALVLGYELLLALTVPPNNWDSLTYHLARAAAWAQHGGLYWVPDAPTDRINEFQPLAEQGNLFLFAAGTTRLYALPQYLAQLAILVAVYGAARRLGFEVRVAASTAALLATFSLVALESTTAQNDLVAASFPVVAACLLLGPSRTEWLLAGAALGMGVGAKLTTALTWPALALLGWARGRQSLLRLAAGAAGAFVLAGMWGYVLNLVHTGHALGPGLGQDVGQARSLASRPATVVRVLYRMFDLSVLSDHLIRELALAGLVAGLVAGAVTYRRRGGGRKAVLRGAALAAALATPFLVYVGAGIFAAFARAVHAPVGSGFPGPVSREANEDVSAFGPVGTAMLLLAPVLTAVLYLRRRADLRHLALALALPVFLILLAATVAYNPFLTRFLLVPAVLTAPLAGFVLQSRAASAGLLVVGAVTIALTLELARGKSYHSLAGHPWHMTEPQALSYVFDDRVSGADAAYEQLVPRRACVGAVLGLDEPSYLLWGRDRTRRVFYLPADGAVDAALRHGLFYVVIGVDAHAPVAGEFRAAGWEVVLLGRSWLLAREPNAGAGDCR